ncbi:MAG TPA: HAD-IG family 5'-nucleotidase [Holophagaceae bacterium]|nr:HAD-IG family 5'-nucleotidase [Holophagaceae bacterium]
MSDSIPASPHPRSRGVFCNRTLNFRSLKAIGYDMDYTLVDYRAEAFEERVYELARASFLDAGWPVGELRFDAEMVARGLVIDLKTGNLVKANRFGFVKRAFRGTRALSFSEQRDAYGQTLVELSDPRWIFLNTVFSLSEGCLFAQLMDLFESDRLPGVRTPAEVYDQVRLRIEAQHIEGRLKAEILQDPERYVILDPEAALALLDQRAAGKRLLLITNSEWGYTAPLMSYAYDRYLPQGMTWRDLFDIIIVSARKPAFFTERGPFFEVVDEQGLLKPLQGRLRAGGTYLGGSAAQVERDLGLSGDQVLYVGDHMFGDVHMSKRRLRWRTGLVLRELEAEVEALEGFREAENRLADLMALKEELEAQVSRARLELQRHKAGYGPTPTEGPAALDARIQDLKARLTSLDTEIAPLAQAATELLNPRWGLLTRAGNDKSHLARQIERYADVYTSRVSNFLHATPYVYLRSSRGSLPHDPSSPGGPPLAV